MRRARGSVSDPLDGDLVEVFAVALPQADAAIDDGSGLGQRPLQAAHQDHLQLGVDQLDDVEGLPAVAMMEKAAGACERVDEIATLGDEEAWGHDLFEERIVGAEKLRQRLTSAARLKGQDRDTRVGGCHRMDARIDRNPGVAAFAVDAPVLVDDLEAARDGPRRLAGPEEQGSAAVEREMEE